ARVLDELADAEARVALHQLEAQAAALGQAGADQLEARVVQVVLRHRDRTGGLVDPEGDLRRAQQVGGLGRGLGIQAGIERGIGRLLRPEEDVQAGGDRQRDRQQGPELPAQLHLLQLDHRRGRLLGGLFAVEAVLGKGHCHLASVPGHSGMFMTSWYACTSRLRTSTVARKATCDCCEAIITRARSAPGSPRSNAVCSSPALAWVALTPSRARARVWVKLGAAVPWVAPGACMAPSPWIASLRATSPARAAAWPSWPW